MKDRYLNKVCLAVTGFTIFQFILMMYRGYVPTISQRTRRGRILTQMLKANKWKVFERS